MARRYVLQLSRVRWVIVLAKWPFHILLAFCTVQAKAVHSVIDMQCSVYYCYRGQFQFHDVEYSAVWNK